MVQEAVRARSGAGAPAARGRAVPLISLAVLVFVVALGPRARFEGGWVEPDLGPDVEAWISAQEARVPGLAADEAAGIVWADPAARAATPLSIVYLHGFSADRHEVEPLVSDLGEALRANAFFARLSGHALGGAALGEASVADWLADASAAVAVGGRIGERVVLVGTSTGGTLALWAAAQPEARGRVAALVLVSPNLGLRDRSADVLTWPWGALLARLVVGAERCFEPETPEQERHWTVCYPIRALLPMMALVDHVQGMDLSAVRTPTLLVYASTDQVVDPEQSLRLLASLGDGGPTVHVVEGSGDPAGHVIAGDIMSPGTTAEIRERVVAFLAAEGLVEVR